MLPVPEIRRGWRRLATPASLLLLRVRRRSTLVCRADGCTPVCAKLTRGSLGSVSMQIDERAVGDVVVLDLKGKITLGKGDELLKDKVNSLVNQGHRKILLNLAEVPY